MLARYRIVRGRRSPDDPLPEGRRIDTRKHTRHFLRPEAAAVRTYLAAPDDAGWKRFRDDYLRTLERRHAEDPTPFDELAREAREAQVFIGCNCPTKTNPDVSRCHTVLALEFMRSMYPELRVVLPEGVRGPN